MLQDAQGRVPAGWGWAGPGLEGQRGVGVVRELRHEVCAPWCVEVLEVALADLDRKVLPRHTPVQVYPCVYTGWEPEPFSVQLRAE